MDIELAKAFKARVETAIAELSGALLIAEKSCSAEELSIIKKSIGHLISDADLLLQQLVYADHPDLDDLKGQG